MLMVISPAKTLDYDPIELETASRPRFQSQTKELAGILKEKTAQDLADLMDISDQLATENERRYQRFGKRLKPEERKQAIFAFKGSVYQGLDVSDFTEEDLAFAQDHLRILSGLYGLLRPLDKIQAYRLEMGTKLENPAGKNLYDYWDQSITEKLNSDLPKGEEKVLLNLASQEYFKAVKPAAFKGKIIHINFKEERDGKYKIISFNAKVARGLMARYIIKNKITKSSDIKAFSEDNYLFNDKLSDEFNWIFTR